MREIQALQRRLDSKSHLQTKEWFENYLKHTIPYRGVNTPAVIKIVRSWIKSEKLSDLSHAAQFSIACQLIRQEHAEDKFSGVFLIEMNLLDKIEFDQLVSSIEKLFADGAFTNWSTTDGMSVRVLSPLIHLHGEKAVTRFSSWCNSKDLWQRRSSVLSLRACVNSPQYFPVMRKVVEQLSYSRERFIQTGIGWLIADLSKKNPMEAEMMVEMHLERLSMEVIRRHTKYLRLHEKYIEKRRQTILSVK